MKLLIIGSKGFIGSYLAKHFQNSGNHDVWTADVFVDYEQEKYFLIDASNSDFEDLFINQQFDVCINCSGAASVTDSLKNPQRDFYLNALNVFNLLDGIRKHQPTCKFVNLSSAAVYGNPKCLPILENTLCDPLSPYGYHKRNAELICEEFTRFYGLKTCSLRIFSAYGNGLKKQLFWDLAQKTIEKTDLVLFGTGQESRDFIHIYDIVRTIDLVIEKGDFNADYYNIANGKEIVIDFASRTLLEALGWNGVLTFNQLTREGDPLNWCANIDKLKALGYQQSVDISDGLKEYAAWLKS